MPHEKAPAFQFYPRDFLTDEKVVLMSNTETGIYIRLLSFCWLEGSLPLETESLTRMARMPLRQFTKIWEHSVLRSCFQVGEDGRLHHKRLDEERAKQTEYRRRQSDKGKASAEAKSEAKKSTAVQPDVNRASTGPPAPVQPKVNSSSASAFASAEKTKTPAAADDRSKRPIFKGTRFVVFDWQLDDLRRLLGTRTLDAFHIDEFFHDLNGRMEAQDVAVPQRDGGQWLQGQVLAEAKRRGIPIASAGVPSDPAAAILAIMPKPSVRP